MPASEARIGWNAEVQIGLTADVASLVEIGEVRSFSMPTDERDEHEVTHLKSPDQAKEFIAGLKDRGEMTVQINYVPGSTSDILLTAAADTPTVRAIRVIIPDNDGAGTAAWQHTMSGFVKRYAPDNVEPNAPITASLTLRMTGARSQAAEGSEAAS